jgi:hypothetical protein
MPEQTHPSSSDSDARFIGWQENLKGEVLALYNITAANHPLYGSTVTGKSLRDMNLHVPDAPPPEGPVGKL